MAVMIKRRGFLKGLAAGIAVAAMPPSIAIAERTEAAVKIIRAPEWKFVVRGGNGGVGDSLIMIPPGLQYNPVVSRQIMYPEILDTKKQMNDGQFELIPWRPYQSSIEALIPEDVWPDYLKACQYGGTRRSRYFS